MATAASHGDFGLNAGRVYTIGSIPTNENGLFRLGFLGGFVFVFFCLYFRVFLMFFFLFFCLYFRGFFNVVFFFFFFVPVFVFSVAFSCFS